MLEEIQQPIAAELERYKALFRAALHSDNELLSAALNHLTRKLGKMMRPTLVILCAREGGRVTDEVLHAAAGLEMLHTASLVHDDVVDESMMRRGQRSVNALYDNKAAVLVGDFITSMALSQVALTRHLDIVDRMAHLGQITSPTAVPSASRTTTMSSHARLRSSSRPVPSLALRLAGPTPTLCSACSASHTL